MFSRSLVRTGLLVCKLDSVVGTKCILPALNAGDRRQGASSSAGVINGSKVKTIEDGNKLKTMEDLDGPSFITSLYWLFGKGYFQTTHQMQIEHSKIYGPLWRSKYGPLVIVNVASADLIEQVLRQEGRHPIRTDMPHWRGYRELRNHAYGPLTEMGAKWQRIRSILNPRMLKPKHVSSYTNAINEVVRDFVQKVDWLRKTTGDGVMVNDLAGELYKFAFEGISSVLFETRLGCLNEKVPEETERFIFSVGEMFRLSPIIVLFPRSLWPYLPFWKHFVAVWDHLFTVAEDLVQKKMEEIQERVKKGEPVAGEYLTHLLVSEQMSVHEVLGSITELLLAGVDTTSNTISWALYHMASEPEIQERLYQEVESVCPGDKVPTSDDIARMPLLKAIIRETLRLYPVVPGNARITVENEIVVGGHRFPKQTLFHLCHYAVSYDEKIFPDPHAFLPERWLRGADKQLNQHPFGSVPFGFGIRACLGRRVAELEMYLVLSQLIKHYEVRPDPTGQIVKPITRTLLVPATPMNLQFLNRGAAEDEPRETTHEAI
ncbi:cytochrome P450 [Alosa pseudoharengus]|uniref:cytochrome P450 n=1 Tax=Alosa pseudoharengus TaxID=34774 RepID=UPI003F8AAADC